MVATIFVSIAVVSAIALLCFKGIKINFNKTFTINDNRKMLTIEQTQDLEKKLNPDRVKDDKDNKDEVPMGAPMDSVLGTIAEIFGPEDKDGEDKK